MHQKNGRIKMENVLQMVLEDPESVFSKHARMLSDLTSEQAAKLRAVLSQMETEKRIAFFTKMVQTEQEFLEYDFSAIAKIGLDDENGEIRAASIRILGFEDSRTIGEKLLYAAANDPDEQAQIAAIEILGQYMLESEVDEQIPVSLKALKEVLSKLMESENSSVRREAVVSYAVSGDKKVKRMISDYLAGTNPEDLITALRAIRLSLRNDWDRAILKLINHPDEDVHAEAIRTAGALQLREALPILYEIISEFDHISPDLLLTVTEAVAEIGDEGSLDVLETLGEAAVDMDDEITDAIDDCIDTLNMTIQMDALYEEDDDLSERNRAMLQDAIEKSKDKCLSILEEKIPHDLEDDEAIDTDDDDDECDCHDHDHHHHHHHHHEHDSILEDLDPSRFRILDDLASYEKAADRDEDEEELWAEFEEMDEEDLDADSLRDFIAKLEKKRTGKNGKKD